MEKRCEEAREEINMMLDGFLSQKETELVQKHVNQCPACMEYFKELEKMSLGLQSWGQEELEVRGAFVSEVMEKIEGRKMVPFSFHKKISAVVGMAAVMAIVVVSGRYTPMTQELLAESIVTVAPSVAASQQTPKVEEPPKETAKQFEEQAPVQDQNEGAPTQSQPQAEGKGKTQVTQNPQMEGAQSYGVAPQAEATTGTAPAMLTGKPRSASTPHSSALVTVSITFANEGENEELSALILPYQQADGRYVMERETLEEIKTWLEGNGFAYETKIQESDGSLILAVEP